MGKMRSSVCTSLIKYKQWTTEEWWAHPNPGTYRYEVHCDFAKSEQNSLTAIDLVTFLAWFLIKKIWLHLKYLYIPHIKYKYNDIRFQYTYEGTEKTQLSVIGLHMRIICLARKFYYRILSQLYTELNC